MKLLLCKRCGDVFKLARLKTRFCSCGDVSGCYLEDGLHAVYIGENAVPLGIANNTLTVAIANQPQDGPGALFTAFVIEKDCPTFKRIEATEAI